MKLSKSKFENSVSKRIFFSPIISALILVSTIHFDPYNQISDKLDTEIQRPIYSESR